MRSKKSASDAAPSRTGGESSSESIRREVWLRDRGCCATCGSRENLKLSHIVPPSKGGSTTADNLHLLCRACSLSMDSSI
jgi:5-methylcytosine-specific restriction endonuclease McrA